MMIPTIPWRIDCKVVFEKTVHDAEEMKRSTGLSEGGKRVWCVHVKGKIRAQRETCMDLINLRLLWS